MESDQTQYEPVPLDAIKTKMTAGLNIIPVVQTTGDGTDDAPC